ncbi:hypothetical protein IFT77_11745 [Frigoribacterium sp. CFBP 13729]|uniref:hypothetical protein n=1 Tax=Frigoribacterium sp. CFBP 13729 TaxID=2775293 RepID=UPI0017867848|nr:hypothetical protein [Frigoribacterium sp. CFBP 13729]MBD8611161.1 hypothetical protein [Frigoribacterium sp. CFBP 13729]
MPTDPERSENEMTRATWQFVEALGIADTPVRRVLFELANIIAAPGGDEIGLASAGYRILTKEFEEQYTPKSPLRQQLEYIQQSKELFELTGVALREVPGDRFELDEVPETPSELGAQPGYDDDGRAVRRVLRRKYTDRVPHASWSALTQEQINYVRAHLAPRPKSST